MNKKPPEEKEQQPKQAPEKEQIQEIDIEKLKQILTEKKEDKNSEPRAESRGEIEEYKNRLARCLADLDNYKKRAQIEKEQLLNFGNENLIAEMLPAFDTLEKAIMTIEKENPEAASTKGLALAIKLLEDGLKKFGVEKIEAANKPFDPNFHEAIMQKESEGEANIVLEEVQKGYTLNGKLIRPAMVIVSKKN